MRLSPEQHKEIVDLYQSGLSTIKLAKLFGVVTNSVNGLLRRRGIKLRSGDPPRIHQVWNPLNWNDGYIDAKGRFRVYRPDFPDCHYNGYVFRSHVVWWLSTGKRHPRNTELHHKNTIPLDDSISNLEPLSNSDHQKLHKPAAFYQINCEHCGSLVRVSAFRKRDRITRFCSQYCYHESRRK